MISYAHSGIKFFTLPFLTEPAACQEEQLMPITEDKWMTVKEAAERFGMHCQTIYEACATQGLRHARLGKGRGMIRIRSSWLDAWAEAGSNTKSTGYARKADRVAKQGTKKAKRDIPPAPAFVRVTLAEAAQMVPCSVATLERAIEQQKLQFVFVGSARTIHTTKEWLLEWIRLSKVPGGQPKL